MTLEERRRFTVDLIGNVQADILAKLDQMPDEWDGHELRRYIAERFEAASFGLLGRGEVRRNGATKRRRHQTTRQIPQHCIGAQPVTDIDTTNGRLTRVLADIDQLIAWAEADRDASRETGADYQAKGDAQRLTRLRRARRQLEICGR